MTLLLMAILMSLGIMAQDLPYINVNGDVPANSKDNEFVCGPNSVFSQLYPTYNTGYFAEGTQQYSRVADDYTSTSSFNGIRFWGVNYCGGSINPNEIFNIKFYDRNTIDPTIPGAEVNSFTVAATITDMGLSAPWCNSPIYQVDIDFGATVSVLDGWVSVTRQNVADGMTFAVLSNGDGTGNECSYDSFSDIWIPSGDGNMMFCFEDTPPVPLSNWALIMSMILISGFIVIRTRYSAA